MRKEDEMKVVGIVKAGDTKRLETGESRVI